MVESRWTMARLKLATIISVIRVIWGSRLEPDRRSTLDGPDYARGELGEGTKHLEITR